MQSTWRLILEYGKRTVLQWAFVFGMLSGVLLGLNELTFEFRTVTPVSATIIVGAFLIANFRVFASIYRENVALQTLLDQINYAKPELKVYLNSDGELAETLTLEIGEIPGKPGVESDESGYLDSENQYLLERYYYQKAVAAMRYVSFAVCNHGPADGENIRIDCTLHGNVLTANYDLLDAYHNDPPTPPSKHPIIGLMPSFSVHTPYIEPNSPEGPHYHYLSTSFTYTPANLASGACETRLEPIPLIFYDPESDEPSWIQVRAHGKGINPPIDQVLHINTRPTDSGEES